MLTGTPLFEADTLIGVLRAHLEQEPRSLPPGPDGAPHPLTNVLARMVAKDPAARLLAADLVSELAAPTSAFAPAPRDTLPHTEPPPPLPAPWSAPLPRAPGAAPAALPTEDDLARRLHAGAPGGLARAQLAATLRMALRAGRELDAHVGTAGDLDLRAVRTLLRALALAHQQFELWLDDADRAR
jgi:hypothetical protein